MGGEEPEAADPRAPFGRGRCVDGEYEWYEYPEGYDPLSGEQEGVTIFDALEQWDLIVCDFQDVYGLTVDDPACPLTWAQFLTRVKGLFLRDCTLARHFAPRDPAPSLGDEIT